MDGGSATAFTAAGAFTVAGQVGDMDGALILELPNVAAATQGDLIVVQNLLFDDHHFSLHIAVPAAVNETNVANPGAAPSTTESGITALSSTVYRHVYLDDTAVGLGDSSSFTTGTLINTAQTQIKPVQSCYCSVKTLQMSQLKVGLQVKTTIPTPMTQLPL